jgi:hypothetical protein
VAAHDGHLDSRRVPHALSRTLSGSRSLVIDLADLTSLAVRVLDPSGQPDGVMAVAGLSDQLGPPRIVVAGPVHDLAQDARDQLPDTNRLGHATSPGAGIGGTARSPGACSANSTTGSARSPAVARMMAATWW